jgi:hypothetical protein
LRTNTVHHREKQSQIGATSFRAFAAAGAVRKSRHAECNNVMPGFPSGNGITAF